MIHPTVHQSTVRTRIVILGGGFGGLYSALHFEKTIAADPTVEVTLVSRENFVLFTPMLHEVAAGDMDLSDIVCPLRPMLKHVRFLQADVDAIDLEARKVTLAYGLRGERKVVTYDHLVIALGSESNFFNLPGVGERALTMKSAGDAFLLRNHALAMLEMASLTDDAQARRAMLTFVVAGGGFAGVETVGALNDFVREAIAYYPALDEEDLRFILVHPNSVILPELNKSLGLYAQDKLTSRKVEIRADTRVIADTGKPHPPTAQHALREAVRCAKNVVAALRGSQGAPFQFTTLGQLATIGHRVGVAEVFGLQVSGFLAWVLWRTIYLAKLPTLEKKLRVALRWTLDFAFPRDLTQHVTLHGIERVSQLLAYVRQHPVTPQPAASYSTAALRS